MRFPGIMFLLKLGLSILFGWLWSKGFHAVVIGFIVFCLSEICVYVSPEYSRRQL